MLTVRRKSRSLLGAREHHAAAHAAARIAALDGHRKRWIEQAPRPRRFHVLARRVAPAIQRERNLQAALRAMHARARYSEAVWSRIVIRRPRQGAVRGSTKGAWRRPTTADARFAARVQTVMGTSPTWCNAEYKLESKRATTVTHAPPRPRRPSRVWRAARARGKLVERRRVDVVIIDRSMHMTRATSCSPLARLLAIAGGLAACGQVGVLAPAVWLFTVRPPARPRYRK
jgi:hypothetical protein